MSIIIGTPQPNVLVGTRGSDYIDGRAGNDEIFGFSLTPPGGVPNTVAAVLADEADTVFGGGGNDLIRSGSGGDFVDGGRGNDTIVGGPGADLLHGGGGHDVFKFEVLFERGNFTPPPGNLVVDTLVGEGQRDVILDFRQGRDKIDVTGWENRQNPGAHFIGQDDPSSAPDLQIGFHHEGGNTIVELTGPFLANAVGGPTTSVVTGEIQIQGEFRLHASDFIF
jgi:Ca2+-binding RTX toxin-like protein